MKDREVKELFRAGKIRLVFRDGRFMLVDLEGNEVK